MRKSMFELVSEMNTAFGNPKGDPGQIDWGRLVKQCSNIPSECRELMTAIGERDLDETRDALCDINVFTLGGHHFAGTQVDADGVSTLETPKGDPDLIDWDGLVTVHGDIQHKYAELTHALAYEDLEGTCRALTDITTLVVDAYHRLGIDVNEDMQAVVAGVMTRFCQDEADHQATAAKYEQLGVEFYAQGVYPTLCLKSARDQEDRTGESYPKGKFLKSVSYRQTVFPPVGAAARV